MNEEEEGELFVCVSVCVRLPHSAALNTLVLQCWISEGHNRSMYRTADLCYSAAVLFTSEPVPVLPARLITLLLARNEIGDTEWRRL